MRLTRFARLLPILATISLTTCSQHANRTVQTRSLELSTREALARPLLLQAEAASKTFDTTSRSLLLYRIAGTWLPLEPSNAVRLYRDSFASAREPTSKFRVEIENEILNDLLPLSPSDVLDLLPSAEPETQNRLYGALINYWLLQGDSIAGTRVFDHAIAAGALPVRPTIHLLANLNAEASADRNRVFSAVVSYYKAHPNSEGFHWTLANFVARFYSQSQSATISEAVNFVLAEAERRDRQHSGGGFSMSAQQNSIKFGSEYDFQLFAVAPALQQLDSSRAAVLLSQHPEVAADLTRYPLGLASLDPDGFSLVRESLTPDHRKPIGLQLYNTVEEGQSLSPMDMGLEFTVPRNPFILGVTGSFNLFADPQDPETSILDEHSMCPADTPRRLELARTVSIQRLDTFPRANLIQVIAERCTYYSGPTAARLALQDEVSLLDQMPAENQLDYLAVAADLYLRLGDRESAGDVILKGFAVAHGLYERDLSSERLQSFPKGVWPSAEAYRRMITLGVNASLGATLKQVNEIPDASLRELNQVMLARALLGVPVRRYIVANPNGGFIVGEVEVSYDQF